MMQNVRMKNLDKFTNNKQAILFCTDIGARGLDIPKVDLVIHYHIPNRTDIFIHRSGRTARANQSGKVSSLISEKELGLYRRIMVDLNYKQFSNISSLIGYPPYICKMTYSISSKPLW